jgi:hypothetical protein
MTTDNFPNGITSFGIPIVGGTLPPFTGNYFFVDYGDGNDGNTGAPDNPLKTLAAAYAKTTSGNNDVVFIVGNGSYSTYTQRLTATLTWANNATHLIGLTAPSMFTPMARISNLTTATAEINPMLAVSGNGCIFSNFSMFQGVGQSATPEQLVDISGSNNYFGRIHFGGMGATASTGGAASTSSYVLNFLSGAQENLFENCVVGLDTVARTVINSSVKFTAASGSTRNVFRNCIFPACVTGSGSGAFFIDASASTSVDRFNTFQNCLFTSAIGSTGSAISAAVNPPTGGGIILLDNCTSAGVTAWSGASSYVYATTATSTASAGGGLGTHP